MKKTFCLIFILLIHMSIAAEYKFGRLDPTGYRAYIYNETFTTQIFLTPEQNIQKILPEPNYFNILYTPLPLITFEIEGKEDRLKELIEFNVNLTPLIDLRIINTFSSSLECELSNNDLIHHGIYFRRDGIFTTGFMFINSFSTFEPRGYKINFFNQLELTNFNIISLFESRDLYISPYCKKQSSGRKSRVSLDVFLTDNITTTFINDLDFILDDEGDLIRENSVNLKVLLPLTELTLKGAIKDINKREYKYGIDVDNIYSIFQNELSFDIRYINANLYYFSDRVTVEAFPDLFISAKYNFDLEEIVEQELVYKIDYDVNNFNFAFIFIRGINDLDDDWDMNLSIYYTGH